MNHVLFISDLHLQESEPEKTKMFLHFLKTEALQAKALYILGDLFEAWIGDDVNTEFNTTIQLALKQFASSGIPIYLMRGNRDFLLGKNFAQNTGCILIEDPNKINLYGKATLLTHGDLLCTNDHTLMWFRKYAHNPKLHKYFLWLPIFIRKFLAQKIRTKSKKDALKKTGETRGVVTTTMLNLMHQYQAEQLIYGHVHRAACHELSIDGIGTGRYITLGAWDKAPSYLLYYEDHTIKQEEQGLI